MKQTDIDENIVDPIFLLGKLIFKYKFCIYIVLTFLMGSMVEYVQMELRDIQRLIVDF